MCRYWPIFKYKKILNVKGISGWLKVNEGHRIGKCYSLNIIKYSISKWNWNSSGHKVWVSFFKCQRGTRVIWQLLTRVLRLRQDLSVQFSSMTRSSPWDRDTMCLHNIDYFSFFNCLLLTCPSAVLHLIFEIRTPYDFLKGF